MFKYVTTEYVDRLPQGSLLFIDNFPYELGSNGVVPLCVLDNPALTNGPYTEDQVKNDKVAVVDWAIMVGHVYQVKEYRNSVGTCYSPCIYQPGRPLREYPFFLTAEDAIAYIQKNNIFGTVIRYVRTAEGKRSGWSDGVVFTAEGAPISIMSEFTQDRIPHPNGGHIWVANPEKDAAMWAAVEYGEMEAI